MDSGEKVEIDDDQGIVDTSDPMFNPSRALFPPDFERLALQ
jgi:hypothetical protein